MALTSILTGMLILTVTFLIRAEFQGSKTQVYFFKPTSTLIIIGVIILSYFLDSQAYGYKTAILIAMIFCLGGDIALMFESEKAFKIGLVLFLVGHIFYGGIITYFNDFAAFDSVYTTIVILLGLPIFLFLYPSLEKLKVPVIFYMIVISFMLNAALLSFDSAYFNELQAWHLALGAGLFYLSDVMLAINKFRFPFKLNRISLAFYFGGQLLLALSTHYINLPA